MNTTNRRPTSPAALPTLNTSFILLGIMDERKIKGISPKKTTVTFMLNTCEIPNEALK
ncbi:hypothetical protein D3C76_464750 [compost metagenome]